MTAARRPWAAELLRFWFRELRADQWFRRDDQVDVQLSQRAGRWLTALGNRPARDFLADPTIARAAILLFDQCPRNLFRASARSFAYDSLAREICKVALARGWDTGLALHEKQFLYMPLMHSEAIADQLLSLRLLGSLGDAFILGFARAYYRMIARFGRFPHRNALLGRKSTAAEERAVDSGNAW